jgi:hypothetical protein
MRMEVNWWSLEPKEEEKDSNIEINPSTGLYN